MYLADAAAIPAGLNLRHPDFAAFGVRLGRAVNRENEFITALQVAEADKSLFCVENDAMGAALVNFLGSAGGFTGTAAELLENLRLIDPDLQNVSAKRLGKRLVALWPHLTRVFTKATKELDRKNFTVFSFRTSPGFEEGVI